ncbi:MAG: cohesin domain-containing protein [Dehalococcoidia bacterium]
MKGLTAIALLVALGTGVLVSSQASAQETTLKIGSTTVVVGAESTVGLETTGVGPPGLAAWSIDILYDPAIVDAVACEALNDGLCNANFGDDTVRVTGASASGVEGDFALATITFRCLTTGSTSLSVGPLDFADATIGAPQQIDVAVEDGSVTCQLVQPTEPDDEEPADEEPTDEAPEPTATPAPDIVAAGTGFGDFGDGGPFSPLVAGLMGAGAAWLVAGLAAIALAMNLGPGRLWGRAQAEDRPERAQASSEKPARAPAQRSATAQRAASAQPKIPTWLVAAQRELSSTSIPTLPRFRRRGGGERRR